MAAVVLANNAESTLASGISSIATSLTVADASSFPALSAGDWFNATIESTSGALEIVRVTAISGNTFTITRAQESTLAIPFSTGARVELRLTVQNLEDQFSAVIATDVAAEVTSQLAASIGVTVQGYDAGLAWLDSLNFTNEATFKAAVNLETGVDVQAYNANLTTWAAKTAPSGTVVGHTDTQTLTNKTINDFTNSNHADTIHQQVRNETGVTIAAGTPVYVTGFNIGNNIPTVAPANASSAASMGAIGITAAAITNNSNGEVVQHGVVTNMDTSALTEGAIVYVGTSAGALTSTIPTGTNLVQVVGRCIRSHASSGRMSVRVVVLDYLTGLGASVVQTGTASAIRTLLGLVIGTDVQAYDAGLAWLDTLNFTNEATFKAAVNAEAGVDFQAYNANLTTYAGIAPSANVQSLLGAADYAAMRTLLGLVIGTNVQAYDAQLADLAGIVFAQGDILYFNGLNLVALGAGTSGHYLKTQGAGANPTWAAVAGTLSDGDKGDITVSASGATWTIDAGVVTLAKMANLNQYELIGRSTAAAGVPEAKATSADVWTMLGSANNAAIRTNIGLAIGTDVQAYDADLTTWAGVTPAVGITTFLATPSSANLLAAVTDETGTGSLVFATSPTLVTPALGAATATSVTATGLLQAGTTLGISTDVLLNRDAAAVLALRNGVTAQTLRVYGTYSDSSNYERAAINLVAATSIELAAETAGTGGDNLDLKLTAAGTGRVKVTGHKEQMWIPAAAMKPRTSNGCAALATTETTTNKVCIETLDYDSTAAEYAQFTIRAPKSWGTSTFTAKFYWKHAATATNFGVVWGIQAGAFGDNEALDTAFGTAQTVADTGGTTNNHYVTAATAAVTVANFTAEENIYFQVYRLPTDASDTMAIDAGLIGVLLEWTPVQVGDA